MQKDFNDFSKYKTQVQDIETKANPGYRTAPSDLSCTPLLAGFPCPVPHFCISKFLKLVIMIHKNFNVLRNTKQRYRKCKSRKIKGTGHPLGTCPVPHFSSVFYVLYLGFVFQNSLWHGVGQENQGTGQITKVGYRTRIYHEKWTTGQVGGKANGTCGRHMRIIRPRWESRLWNCLKGNAYD